MAATDLSLLLHLNKAKSLLAQWQKLPWSSPKRDRLQTDVDDECKSITWQVGGSHLSNQKCCHTHARVVVLLELVRDLTGVSLPRSRASQLAA